MSEGTKAPESAPLPCPDCGSGTVDSYVFSGVMSFCTCFDCGKRGPIRRTAAAASAAWQRIAVLGARDPKAETPESLECPDEQIHEALRQYEQMCDKTSIENEQLDYLLKASRKFRAENAQLKYLLKIERGFLKLCQAEHEDVMEQLSHIVVDLLGLMLPDEYVREDLLKMIADEIGTLRGRRLP